MKRKIIALSVLMIFCMSISVFAARIDVDAVKKKFEDEITAYTTWECLLCGRRVSSGSTPPQYKDCKYNPGTRKHDWRAVR